MKTPSLFKIIIPTLLASFLTISTMGQQGTLVVHEDPKIQELLKIQKELEKENKLSIGYTIQLYYGELEPANEVLKKYKRLYPDWPASIEYETPNYKVWAGNFTTRIEAERVLLLLKKDFSAAFILKPDRKK